jgi:hypothetical protein
MLIFKLFVTLLAGVLLVVPVTGQTRPDFSGEWKLNEKASAADGPKGIMFHIDHKDPAFHYIAAGKTTDGQRFTEKAKFTIDGKAHPGIGSGTIAAHWKDRALVIQYDISGSSYTLVLRLSSDGRQMLRDVFGNREVYDRR